VVSLSGIGPQTLDRCADLAAALDPRRVPLSLLVVPRELGRAQEWVRHRASLGDAVVLHGLGQRRLPAHEAGLLLMGARVQMDAIGLNADTFAPRRCVASPGTLIALAKHRFNRCADAHAVRDLGTGLATLGRLHALTERSSFGELRTLALVYATARSARRGGLTRITVDARDLHRTPRRPPTSDCRHLARRQRLDLGALRLEHLEDAVGVLRH
jgi:predicted deacetylase